MKSARPQGAALAVIALSSVVLSGRAAAEGVQFRGLGFVPGGNYSYANGVSADGKVVVGDAGTGGVSRDAFRWTAETGMVRMGPVPGGSASHQAFAASADGSVVAGIGVMDGRQFATRWTAQAGVVRLPDVPGEFLASGAGAISGDGSVIAGFSNPDGGEALALWTSAGVESIGTLRLDPTRDTGPRATGVSADGSVVVGFSHSANGLYEALRWTRAGGMVGLGDLPGDEFYSVATAVSADGATVVGYSRSSFGEVPFRWTEQGGMVRMGYPLGVAGPGAVGGSFGHATGVSGDGSIIVGTSSLAAGQSATIWDAAGGTRTLQSELARLGLDLTGWSLIAATGISPDGQAIAGAAFNPSGQVEAFLVTGIPEPAGAVALLAVAAGVLSMRRRGAS